MTETSKLRFVIAHQLTEPEALIRIRILISKMGLLTDLISDLTQEWQNNLVDLNCTHAGAQLSGRITVLSDSLDLFADTGLISLLLKENLAHIMKVNRPDFLDS